MEYQRHEYQPLVSLFYSAGERKSFGCLIAERAQTEFKDRVELAYLLSQRVDSPTSVISAPLLSHITGHPIALKLDYELSGWATKTRGVWGLISERIEPFVLKNLLKCDEVDPINKALCEAFNDSTVVACTSGNHGIATAEVLNLLSYRAGFNISIEILIPQDTPCAKLEHLEALKVKITPYTPEEDRIAKMNDICARLKTEGKVAIPFPTEPVPGNEGGLAGLGTLGREIHHEIKDPVTVFLPASSGPTAAAVIRYLRDVNSPHSIQVAQDVRNGCLADLFCGSNCQCRASVDTTFARGKLLNAFRECGKAVNGLSTKHVNDVAAPVFRHYLRPENVTLVSPSLMAVASLLVYLETRKISQAVKPELAGACSVAGLLARSLIDRDSRSRLCEVLLGSGFSCEELAAFAEITPDELHQTVYSAPNKGFVFGEDPGSSLCVITGANCRQPYFIALSKGFSKIAEMEKALVHPLFQAQIIASWKRILEDFT